MKGVAEKEKKVGGRNEWKEGRKRGREREG